MSKFKKTRVNKRPGILSALISAPPIAVPNVNAAQPTPENPAVESVLPGNVPSLKDLLQSPADNAARIGDAARELFASMGGVEAAAINAQGISVEDYLNAWDDDEEKEEDEDAPTGVPTTTLVSGPTGKAGQGNGPLRNCPIFLGQCGENDPDVYSTRKFLKDIGLPLENELVQQLGVIPSGNASDSLQPTLPGTWLQANGFTGYRQLLEGALVFQMYDWQMSDWRAEDTLVYALRPVEPSRGREGDDIEIEFEVAANAPYRLNFIGTCEGQTRHHYATIEADQTVVWTRNPLLGVMAASQGFLVNILTHRGSLRMETVTACIEATRHVLKNYEYWLDDAFGQHRNLFLFDIRDEIEEESNGDYNVFRLIMEGLESCETRILTVGPEVVRDPIARYRHWNSLLSAYARQSRV